MSDVPPTPPDDGPVSESPAPKRSFGRRVARFAWITGTVGVGVVGLVGLGAGAGVLWLTTSSGNEFIRTQAVEQAEPFIPEGRLDIQEVDTSLFGHFILRGVSISSPSGKRMLAADEVRLRYDLSHVLQRRLDVLEVALIHPAVDVEVLSDGNLDLVAAFGPAAPSPPESGPPAAWVDVPADIRISKVVLDGGTIRYRDASSPDAPMDVQVAGLELGGAVRVHQRTADLSGLHLGVASVDGLELDLPLPLSVDADLDYDESRLTVEQLAIQARKTALGISGHIDRVDFEDRVLGLQVDQISLDEGDIEALAGDDVLLGDLSITGTIAGSVADLTTTLVTRTPGGVLNLSASVDTTAEPLAWKVDVATPGLDVDAMTPLVPEPTHLNMELVAEGQGTDPSKDLAGTFRLTARDQVVFNESLPELILGGRIDAGVVQVEEFGAVHEAAQVTATGRIDLNNELVDLREVNARVPSLVALRKYGVVGLRGSFGYAGSVRVNGFGEGGVVLAEGGLDLRRFGAQDAVSVQSLSGPAQVRVDLDTTAVTVSGVTKVRGVAAPGTSVGGMDLQWSASVKGGGVLAETTLTLTDLSLGEGAVTIDRIATAEGRRFRGGVDGSGEPWAVGRLFMEEMGFGTAGYKANGGEVSLAFRDPDGGSGPDSARLNVGFDLERDTDSPFFQGRVSGDLITGAWLIEDLVLAPSDEHPLVAEGPVSFKLADGGARDIDAFLRSDVGSFRAKGNWVPDSADASSLDLTMEKVDLAHVSKMAQLFIGPEREGDPKILEGLSGVASLHAKLDDAPDQDLELDIAADFDGIVYPGMVRKLYFDAEVQGPITEPYIHASLEGERDNLLAALTGTVPLRIVEGAPQLDCSRRVDLDAIVGPGNVQRFSATLPVVGELPKLDASAALIVAGTACDPDLSLVSSASVPIGLQGERVRLDLDLHRTEGQVDIEGGVDIGLNRRVLIDGHATTNLTSLFESVFAGGEMPPTDALSTFASAIDLTVSPIDVPLQELNVFAAVPRGVAGTIDGRINLSGNSATPVLSTELEWKDGALGEVGIDDARFHIIPVDESYTLDGDLRFSTGGSLLLDGHIPFAVHLESEDEIDLARPGFEVRLTGKDVPLKAIEGLSDGITEAEGVLSLDGGLSGTLEAPVPALELGIRNGRMAVRETRLVYSDLAMDASFTQSSLTLDKLKVRADPWGGQVGFTETGFFMMSGAVGLSETYAPTDVDFTVRANNFWVADRKDLRLKISSDKRVKVRGTYPAIQVRGGIAIDEGKLALDESVFMPVSDLALDPLLVVHRRDEEFTQGTTEVLAEGDDISKHLDVELTLDMSKPFRLAVTMPMDSSMGSVGASLSTATVDLDVTSPGLEIGLKEGDLSLVGDVEMGRGALDFFGSSFDIGGGKLSFTGKNYTDPVMELQAVRHTGRYGDVAANIAGTASKFDVEFQSEDYPDQTDILSILLFGKPASELGDSEGQSGGSQLSAALAMAAGSQVNRALGSTLGGKIEFDQGAVKAGVPVGDKLFLSIERHSNVEEDENVLAVALEWLITRQMYAEVVTGDAGQSSGDLYMRWRF